VHSAAVFVIVGVDSNHFRYVQDFEVVVQGLVGDVPGGTTYNSGHFYWNIGRILVLDGLLHPIALARMSRWVALLSYIRLVCCLGIAVNVCLLASS